MDKGSRKQETPIEKLFAVLQARDLDSFDEAFRPIRQKIGRLAQKRLQREEVEDVVQQTMSTLWEKRASVRGPDHLMPFIFQVLRNKLGDAYRRKKLNTEMHVSGPEVLNSLNNQTLDTPELILEEKELERILGRAIDLCASENGHWGKILRLLQQGRTKEEIRKEIGNIPMATVYTKIYRARQRLMKILEDEFGVKT